MGLHAGIIFFTEPPESADEFARTRRSESGREYRPGISVAAVFFEEYLRFAECFFRFFEKIFRGIPVHAYFPGKAFYSFFVHPLYQIRRSFSVHRAVNTGMHGPAGYQVINESIIYQFREFRVCASGFHRECDLFEPVLEQKIRPEAPVRILRSMHMKIGKRRDQDIAAVIIEGIQGVGGIIIPDDNFMRELRVATEDAGVPLILDEVQSGYCRTGKFFAHQWAGIKPDLITMAKGMAGGFPIGGVLISPEFEPVKGMLGTTFGGNHLAMAAAIAVADIIKDEDLVSNALTVGTYLKTRLQALSDGAPASEDNATLGTRGGTGAERSEASGGAERSEASELPGAPSDHQPMIKEVRGRGLMTGVEFDGPVAEIRKKLLFDKHIFTGVSGKNMIRLLAPLVLTKDDVDIFIKALEEVL